jgi:hypothetical protein
MYGEDTRTVQNGLERDWAAHEEQVCNKCRHSSLHRGAVPVFGVCEQLVHVVQHNDGTLAW